MEREGAIDRAAKLGEARYTPESISEQTFGSESSRRKWTTSLLVYLVRIPGKFAPRGDKAERPFFNVAEGQRATWPQILDPKMYLTIPFVSCLPGIGTSPTSASACTTRKLTLLAAYL